jgi:superkiller protein 3
MRQQAVIIVLVAVAIAGCDGAATTSSPSKVARQQWDDARAGVLAVLAQDQFRNGSFEKCQATLDEAVRLSPRNVDLHLLGVRLAIERGDLESARARLDALRPLAPTNPQVDYLSGVVLQRWQRPAAAMAAYAAAAAKDPGEVSYVMAEAEMMVAVGRVADAVALLRSQLDRFDHSAPLRDAVGQLLVQQHQYAEAANALRQATLLAGDDDVVREHLGLALFYAGQYSEAADVLGRLVRAEPHAKRADLLAALGGCQEKLGQAVSALGSLTAAADLEPDVIAYPLAAGRVAAQLGDLPEAGRLAARAVAIGPTNGEAQCLLGYVRLRQGKLEQSLAAFQAAATTDPADTTDLCLQGLVLARLGRRVEARAAFDRARQIHPDEPLIARCVADAGE